MTMREHLKRAIAHNGAGFLFGYVRAARRAAYALFDAAGYVFVYPFLHHGPLDRAAVGKILIIRTDGIGDMVLSTPALRAVRQTFPTAVIHLAGTAHTRELFIKSPLIDAFIVPDTEKISSDYDLAIALHPGLRQNYRAFRSGARFRIGYGGSGGAFFLNRVVKDDRASRPFHEVASALRVVAHAGCTTENLKLSIQTTVEGDRFADAYWRANRIGAARPVIALHPGASRAYIRWSPEGFAAVADALAHSHNAAVMLVGGSDDRPLIDHIATLMTTRPLLVCGMPLTRLISLLRRCRVFIGNSSGPLHIAAALSLPSVAIFGPTHPLDNPSAWAPWGNRHIIVRSDPGCIRCHPTDCASYACMNDLEPGTVIAAAVSLLTPPNDDSEESS